MIILGLLSFCRYNHVPIRSGPRPPNPPEAADQRLRRAACTTAYPRGLKRSRIPPHSDKNCNPSPPKRLGLFTYNVAPCPQALGNFEYFDLDNMDGVEAHPCP